MRQSLIADRSPVEVQVDQRLEPVQVRQTRIGHRRLLQVEALELLERTNMDQGRVADRGAAEAQFPNLGDLDEQRQDRVAHGLAVQGEVDTELNGLRRDLRHPPSRGIDGVERLLARIGGGILRRLGGADQAQGGDQTDGAGHHGPRSSEGSGDETHHHSTIPDPRTGGALRPLLKARRACAPHCAG